MTSRLDACAGVFLHKSDGLLSSPQVVGGANVQNAADHLMAIRADLLRFIAAVLRRVIEKFALLRWIMLPTGKPLPFGFGPLMRANQVNTIVELHRVRIQVCFQALAHQCERNRVVAAANCHVAVPANLNLANLLKRKWMNGQRQERGFLNSSKTLQGLLGRCAVRTQSGIFEHPPRYSAVSI